MGDDSIVIESDEIFIHRTIERDLHFVVSTEHMDENARYIIPWSRSRHEEVLNIPDVLHFTIRKSDNGARLGYGIISGLKNLHGNVELQRIVVSDKKQGYGRQTLRLIKQWAFETKHAHRFWLDVKESNYHARSLYASEGFTVEGTMRECLKTDDGKYESLVLMSLLEQEYHSCKI